MLITKHSPAPRRQEEPGERIYQQGNPNMISSDWDFPDDVTFGESRQDVYPSRHAKNWFTRFGNRWLW